MFRRNISIGIFATLLFSVLMQYNSLYAQGGELDSIGGKLNRDSFTLCREIRTKFRGIRGQRRIFDKAYEIHEIADNVHRMVVLRAPVRGMDQALLDLSLLVDDLDQSLKTMQLPVLRDPVTVPTGPNGYIFYGGNGYPQPNFQCGMFRCYGSPYRMIPERDMRGVCRILTDMKSSIIQLQAHYSPSLHFPPAQRLFPSPNSVPQFDFNREQGKKSQPLGLPGPLPDQNDSRWKPSRKTAPVFPPVPPREQPRPSQTGPVVLPPLPSVK